MATIKNKKLTDQDKKQISKHIDNKKVALALKRAKGQLEAIIRMLESGEYDPEQALIQLSASSSAVASAKVKMVEEYTKAKIVSSLDVLSKWM